MQTVLEKAVAMVFMTEIFVIRQQKSVYVRLLNSNTDFIRRM
jgi:hypothetical protein